MAQDTEHRTSGRLGGRRVLAIVTNYGVEQDELVVPLEHLRGEGWRSTSRPRPPTTCRPSWATRTPAAP